MTGTEAILSSARRPSSLTETFKRLESRVARLGLNLSLWDAPGDCAGQFAPACRFCRTLRDCRDAPCEKAMMDVARKVIRKGKVVTGGSAVGCCVVGVPVHRRRRVAGAAVACFLTTDMLDEERLARMCDRLGLDRQVVAELATDACRRDPADAASLIEILDWMVHDQQALQVAEDELVNLSTNLTNTYEELSLVYAISSSMRVTQKPREFLQRICDELLEVVNLTGATVVVYSREESGEQEIVVTAGRIGLEEAQVKLLVAGHLVPRFEKSSRGHVENNFISPSDGRFGTHIKNLLAVPMVAEDRPIGMLVGINKRTGEFDSVDMKLVSSVVSQAAVFLANNRLYADLQDLLMGVLHALTASIDAKDPYTCGHSQRVARISKRLTQACGFSREKAEQMYLAGLLHDIGKIGVPEAILRKDGKLTDEEFNLIKCHPVLGARILGGIRQLKEMIVGIRTHHERPDGQGYPHGISGAEVPIEGLILGLADAFDSMTSDRTYRKALSPLEAVTEEIRKHTGTQFAPRVVEALLSLDLKAFLKELQEPAGMELQAMEIGR